MGLLSGALVSGTAVTLLDAGTRRSARAAGRNGGNRARTCYQIGRIRARAAVPRPEPNWRPAANEPRAVAAFEDSDPALTDRPLPGTTSRFALEQLVRTESSFHRNTKQSAARYEPVTREPKSANAPGALNDELAQELALVDRARSALRSGNAASALELVSVYERSYKRPRFAPEASALRIEALIALGRRSEAARLARIFMANHPGHPRTVRLREFLGEAP